ncbi:MAG: TfoX/Sxy family protein [Euryarchaeota archaeon]|nr:TfoX/Sxy family protein [Euryarchaeota archaeon]
MAFDETLAERVRKRLDAVPFEERKMFGGLAFMVNGHMCCGILNDRLVVRLDPDEAQKLLSRAHVSQMDFTGRPMRGYLYVAAAGLKTGAQLASWLERSVRFVKTKPPK